MDKPLLCVHCVDQYILPELNGKKINKDQCIKCYDDPVTNIYKIYNILIIEMPKWNRFMSKMFK